jgi:hypothetical protein
VKPVKISLLEQAIEAAFNLTELKPTRMHTRVSIACDALAWLDRFLWPSALIGKVRRHVLGGEPPAPPPYRGSPAEGQWGHFHLRVNAGSLECGNRQAGAGNCAGP